MSEKADMFISVFFNKLNEDEQKEVISYLKNTENDSTMTKILRQILQEKVLLGPTSSNVCLLCGK